MNPAANGIASDQPQERYAKNFSETMESVIDGMLAEYRKMPDRMDRDEKKQLVQKLDKSGVFTIKETVHYLSKVIGVSHFAKYSYLKEVREN